MKRCPQCKEIKTLDCFSKLKSGRHYSWCKSCSVKKSQKRYAKPEAKIAKKAYDKARYSANPEIAAVHRKSRELNNPGIRSREAARWNAANPSKRKAIALAYKSRRRSIEKDGMTGGEFRLWLERQLKQCHWCNVTCESNYHVDHVMPLSRGGKHEAYNLVISCQPCNQKKSDKHPLDWLSEIGYNPHTRITTVTGRLAP